MSPKKPSRKESGSVESESSPPADVAQFEQNMRELEALVETLEQGDLRLEDSLKLFERGTVLARSCKLSLDAAQLKVRNLMDDNDAENDQKSDHDT